MAKEYQRQGLTLSQYGSIHTWVLANKPKVGICENCRCEAKTDNALRRGKKYEKKKINFVELCRGCHRVYDKETVNLRFINRNWKFFKELERQFGHKKINQGGGDFQF